MLPLLPQAASTIANTSASAMTAAPPRLRDPKPCLTVLPRDVWRRPTDRQSA